MHAVRLPLRMSLLALALAAAAPVAEAQWADRVRAPASDLVATDGAWATSLDPASLAFLESWEVAIQHQEHYRLDGPRTDAVYGATKLPLMVLTDVRCAGVSGS